MQLITVAGPPASGKTSVLLKTIGHLKEMNYHVGIVKFDCLQTEDDELFRKNNITARKGLSMELCPDHFFITNIEDMCEWGENQKFDVLFSESAGLCNRCSPHIQNVPSICVIDQLSGIHAPQKIGPMLKMADIVVITKGDIVSQAEREVFSMKVQYMNPRAEIFRVNGLTGQGTQQLAKRLVKRTGSTEVTGGKLRFPMPMALCSYCLGETRIGREYQIGNVKKVKQETV